MKKLFAIITLFAIMATTASAQVVTKKIGDTIAATGTTYIKFNNAVDGSTGIQFVLSKVSGTITAGTVILQGSVDTTNFVTIPGVDTLTLANATTNTKIWVIPERNPYTSYRFAVALTTATSPVLIPKGYLLRRTR